MAVTKIRKISSWTLLICSIVSIVVLGMFYTGGAVDPAAEMLEPVHTGLLIDWSSALFFATVLSTVLFAAWQFLSSLKADPKGAIMSLVALILFAALLFITYTMGDPTPIEGMNSEAQAYNTAGWLKTTDMWIMTTIILMGLIVACVVWGSLKKMLNK